MLGLCYVGATGAPAALDEREELRVSDTPSARPPMGERWSQVSRRDGHGHRRTESRINPEGLGASAATRIHPVGGRDRKRQEGTAGVRERTLGMVLTTVATVRRVEYPGDPDLGRRDGPDRRDRLHRRRPIGRSTGTDLVLYITGHNR